MHGLMREGRPACPLLYPLFRIWPGNDTGIENLARYIIRAAFSQERMIYIPASAASDGRAKVIYQSKDGRERKVFPALDLPAPGYGRQAGWPN